MLIDADTLISVTAEDEYGDSEQRTMTIGDLLKDCINGDIPIVDAVPVKVIEQIKWERDTAIQQLEEHGIPFCGKADVVSVVRCKDCKYYDEKDHNCLDEMAYARCWMPMDFCSFGERREE